MTPLHFQRWFDLWSPKAKVTCLFFVPLWSRDFNIYNNNLKLQQKLGYLDLRPVNFTLNYKLTSLLDFGNRQLIVKSADWKKQQVISGPQMGKRFEYHFYNPAKKKRAGIIIPRKQTRKGWIDKRAITNGEEQTMALKILSHKFIPREALRGSIPSHFLCHSRFIDMFAKLV